MFYIFQLLLWLNNVQTELIVTRSDLRSNFNLNLRSNLKFITHFSCQKDCSRSIFLLTAYKLGTSKFGSCNLQFNIKPDLRFDLKFNLELDLKFELKSNFLFKLESDLKFDLVTINSALILLMNDEGSRARFMLR